VSVDEPVPIYRTEFNLYKLLRYLPIVVDPKLIDVATVE
jgi:hypothetical protein